MTTTQRRQRKQATEAITDLNLEIGQTVRITKHPMPGLIGTTGTIVDREAGPKPQVKLQLPGKQFTWAALTWVQPVTEPDPTGSQFREGDRVRGQTPNGKPIEGVLATIGHTYASLENDRARVLLTSATLVAAAPPDYSVNTLLTTDTGDLAIILRVDPPQPRVRQRTEYTIKTDQGNERVGTDLDLDRWRYSELEKGDLVQYQGQEWEFRASDGECVTLNQDTDFGVISGRLQIRELFDLEPHSSPVSAKAIAPQEQPAAPDWMVPFVLVVTELRSHPYQLPAIARYRVLSETAQQLRLAGSKNQWKDKVFCLPNDAAWETAQRLHTDLQQALNELANYLRKLGHYPDAAKKLGAISVKKSAEGFAYKLVPGKQNPLSPTVIFAHNPEDRRELHLSSWEIYPRKPVRIVLERHTPQMLQTIGESNGGTYTSPTQQAGHFVCPDDAAWETYLQLHDRAVQAGQRFEEHLQQLGTYSAATADQRYKQVNKAPTSTISCANCQNHQPIAAAEGDSLRCKLDKIPGTISADGCVAAAYAQNCNAWTAIDAQLKSPSAIVPTAIAAELLPDRAEHLTQLEAQITAGIALCQEGEQKIWLAAHTIQSEQLWKEAGFASFEAYCAERWGWKSSNTFEVARSGKVLRELIDSGIPESLLPTSVSQIRPIANLQPEQRTAILKTAAESGKLTAKTIKQAATAIAPPSPSALRDSRPAGNSNGSPGSGESQPAVSGAAGRDSAGQIPPELTGKITHAQIKTLVAKHAAPLFAAIARDLHAIGFQPKQTAELEAELAAGLETDLEYWAEYNEFLFKEKKEW